LNFKEKSKVELKTTCSLCGKPISDKARSNVTRFLSVESRCSCVAPESQPEDAAPEADPQISEAENQLSTEAVIANLGDRYEVQSLLGRGGMGAVYKVRDKELQKTFAIKVLNANLVEDKNSLKRFQQEAEAASGLTSPNLVAVYDYGMGKKGSPYIVMDYLDGTSLDAVLQKDGYLDVPRAEEIFIQVCEAIVHAHSKNVIHRDIKPSNIMLTKGLDGGDFVKLVDFGIAKVLPSQQKATHNLTQTGDIFGSPLYMSPEQCLGNKLDNRTDIYALGCVMYETLTGHPPFMAENPIKIILKHINDVPKAISALPQDYKVPKNLESIIMRCLAKEPQDRYQTAEDLLKDLQAVRDGKSIKLKKLPQKTKLTPSRKRLVLTLCCAVSMGFVTSMAFFAFAHHRSSAYGVNPLADARDLDNKSYTYFVNKDYEKAIPLLLFGLSAYKGNDPYYLADNYQHVGKCYKELGKYQTAVDYYEKALKIYGEQKLIHGAGYGMEAEARMDYADVLRHLGNAIKAALVASGQYTPTESVEPAPNIR
jgi:serine/threonine protein kinase